MVAVLWPTRDRIYGDWRQKNYGHIGASHGWNSALECSPWVRVPGRGSFSLVFSFSSLLFHFPSWMEREREVCHWRQKQTNYDQVEFLPNKEFAGLQDGYSYKLVNTVKCTRWALNNFEAWWAAPANVQEDHSPDYSFCSSLDMAALNAAFPNTEL